MCAVPLTLCPLIAVTFAEVDRLIATNTARPGVPLSKLAYNITLETSLDVACSDLSPKPAFAPSNPRYARNPASAYEYVPFGGQKLAAKTPCMPKIPRLSACAIVPAM